MALNFKYTIILIDYCFQDDREEMWNSSVFELGGGIVVRGEMF